jgi:hypothetical protein
MDADSTEGEHGQRVVPEPSSGIVVEPHERARQQPRHSVLGSVGRNYYFDLFHNKLHEYEHDIDQHHHHGPDHYDIVVHDNDKCGPDNNVYVCRDLYDDGIEYGAADHDATGPVH